jgi:hypothetical protein
MLSMKISNIKLDLPLSTAKLATFYHGARTSGLQHSSNARVGSATVPLVPGLGKEDWVGGGCCNGEPDAEAGRDDCTGGCVLCGVPNRLYGNGPVIDPMNDLFFSRLSKYASKSTKYVHSTAVVPY